MYRNDPLTGLASAFVFRARAHERMRVGDVQVATVKLRGFTDYNARHGHFAGDLLLRKAAESLVDRLDALTTLCARDGGKFLVMVLPGEPEPDLSALGDIEVDVRWHRIGSPEELDALLPRGLSGTLPPGREGRDFIM